MVECPSAGPVIFLLFDAPKQMRGRHAPDAFSRSCTPGIRHGRLRLGWLSRCGIGDARPAPHGIQTEEFDAATRRTRAFGFLARLARSEPRRDLKGNGADRVVS